ncbi:MAG: hypothetical protein LLG00_14730 [Planctomycetaceae bacterium]|nr:hypothetical protein [Planctomycetaceae bacterium]
MWSAVLGGRIGTDDKRHNGVAIGAQPTVGGAARLAAQCSAIAELVRRIAKYAGYSAGYPIPIGV